MQERSRREPAQGFNHRTPAVKRLTTSFDDTTFAEIRELAVAQQTSAADQVRQLVEFGLETLKRAKEATPGV
ncbi:hypothetical protein JJC00_18705 [Bradyrhizobium diazoefficiens]|uniref:hypothetical protein n=1 Tax=Bradyrhizobium diazoefficiens TaxID=1355477 RepID=UPI00190DA9F0|nr:hypothetical protein [Bradyrhizobium diazoefficiens]QQO37460.1 hypothetical protein JJC00_18705 [Bradyrhizobium diazoefficiens]